MSANIDALHELIDSIEMYVRKFTHSLSFDSTHKGIIKRSLRR